MCLDAYRLACRYYFLSIGGFLGVVRVVANGSGGHHDRSVVPERKDQLREAQSSYRTSNEYRCVC